MKKDNKQRLFEMMSRVSRMPLNENAHSHHNIPYERKTKEQRQRFWDEYIANIMAAKTLDDVIQVYSPENPMIINQKDVNKKFGGLGKFKNHLIKQLTNSLKYKLAFSDDDLNENLDINQNPKVVGAQLSDSILQLINNHISDEQYNQISNNSDTFFKFYEELFKGVLSSLYEKYGDSFNTKAGAAPDEYVNETDITPVEFNPNDISEEDLNIFLQTHINDDFYANLNPDENGLIDEFSISNLLIEILKNGDDNISNYYRSLINDHEQYEMIENFLKEKVANYLDSKGLHVEW